MTNFEIFSLKVLRKLYKIALGSKPERIDGCHYDPDFASKIIYDALMADKPCMIARFGANELSAIRNYKSIKAHKTNIIKYIKGETFDWWWNKNILKNMCQNAGFFPPETPYLEKFCSIMIEDIPQVDILGSWLDMEQDLKDDLCGVTKVNLHLLEPFWSETPWTKALEGKKVLIVHPFSKTIEQQYRKREYLFENNLLPEFEIKTIRAVQSIASESVPFEDWFQALDWMKSEIDRQDYDICLIGCGAYGFPLAAHVKRKGKKAFHLGGSLQLLFGISGKRWDNPGYGFKQWGLPAGSYTSLVNEYWVRPDTNERPIGISKVENGCYW